MSGDLTDLERSKAFYTEVLGFAVAAESPGTPDDPATRWIPGSCTAGSC